MLKFSRIFSVLLLLLAFAVNTAKAWEYIVRDNVKYVTMASVRSVYGFTSQKKEGNSWIYEGGSKQQAERVKLKLRAGSQEMYANGLKFILSYPVVEDSTKGMLVSAMDVNKIIHPILMPSYISAAKNFKTIILDPGHGGHDSGARNRLCLEKDLNLIVAKKLKAQLSKKGYNVLLTRETDKFLTLQERVDIANRDDNAVFITIHFKFGGSSAKGLETFTLTPAGTSSSMSSSIRKTALTGNANDSANITLATAVQCKMMINAPRLVRTSMEDRGIKRARFSVLCTIKHPAILVECGFLSNPQEAALIRTEAYQNYLASSIAEGIGAYKGALNRQKSVQGAAPRVVAQTGRPMVNAH